jgi:Leucine-rich repeat (LRR) protein
MLDVRHNPALTWLGCGDNQLTTLDVSQNPALEWLFCDRNQLTELDVSRNPAMTYLACSYNFFSDKAAIIGLDESRLKQLYFDPQGGD